MDDVFHFQCLSMETLVSGLSSINSFSEQVMVESMDPGKLLLYPQILLACFALLLTSYVHVFALSLELLSKVLERVDLNDTTLQHVLLASTPLLPDAAMPFVSI